jgi:hypothetical protein
MVGSLFVGERLPFAEGVAKSAATFVPKPGRSAIRPAADFAGAFRQYGEPSPLELDAFPLC